MYMGLSDDQKNKLEYAIISNKARLKLARMLREVTRREDSDIEIILKNRIINVARQVENLPLYRLETNDEYYYPQEKAWHYAELELVTRRPDSVDLIEILSDLIEEELVPIDIVNDILNNDNSGIYFENGSIEITSLDDIEDDDITNEHPNIRKLIRRIEVMYESEDWSGVLHTSACIFETLAKDIIENPNVENQSLGGFFDSYREHSNLSEPVLDMIKSIYSKRNTEPLAGHGRTTEPDIGKEEAIVILEMTKSFVRMERRFLTSEVTK